MNLTLTLPEVGKFATIEMLQEAFLQQWVLISEPKRTDNLHVEGGKNNPFFLIPKEPIASALRGGTPLAQLLHFPF